MIKVLNIISDKNIGGAGKCVLIFSENYDKEKIDLSVALPEGSLLKKPLLELGVKIYEVRGIADKSFSLKGVTELKKLIKKVKPDVVHTHASMSGRIAARLAGVKRIIYTLHCVYEPSALMKSPVGHIINKTVFALFADRAKTPSLELSILRLSCINYICFWVTAKRTVHKPSYLVYSAIKNPHPG